MEANKFLLSFLQLWKCHFYISKNSGQDQGYMVSYLLTTF